MKEVHFSTTNGERDGRASKFYASTTSALLKSKEQNEKAEAMGLMTRYEVASCGTEGIDPKNLPKS